jgi:hypothetical protein
MNLHYDWFNYIDREVVKLPSLFSLVRYPWLQGKYDIFKVTAIDENLSIPITITSQNGEKTYQVKSGDIFPYDFEDRELDDIYWVSRGNIDGGPAGSSYCSQCVIKAAKEQSGTVDGGWNIESDILPQCETCGDPLAGDIIGSNTVTTLSEWEAEP